MRVLRDARESSPPPSPRGRTPWGPLPLPKGGGRPLWGRAMSPLQSVTINPFPSNPFGVATKRTKCAEQGKGGILLELAPHRGARNKRGGEGYARLRALTRIIMRVCVRVAHTHAQCKRVCARAHYAPGHAHPRAVGVRAFGRAHARRIMRARVRGCRILALVRGGGARTRPPSAAYAAISPRRNSELRKTLKFAPRSARRTKGCPRRGKPLPSA